MKQSIRFIAMLFACFAIYFIFPSCNSGENFTGKKLIGPIVITDHATEDASLTLSDSTNENDATYVQVSRNMTIVWVNQDPKIKILSIAPDPNYHANDPNFFSANNLPQQIGNSPRWRAEVGSPNVNQGILFEKYYITWQLISSGQTYKYDPLLQLNP